MSRKIFLLLTLVLLPALTLPLTAQVAPPRPEGVTDSSIAWGRQLFHGSANCAEENLGARSCAKQPSGRATQRAI
jgi:hypothetical protein